MVDSWWCDCAGKNQPPTLTSKSSGIDNMSTPSASRAVTSPGGRRRSSNSRRRDVVGGDERKRSNPASSPTRTDSQVSDFSVTDTWYDELDQKKAEGAKIIGDDDFDVDFDDDLHNPPSQQRKDAAEEGDDDDDDDLDDLLNDDILND